jgi:hypothetical protein
MGRLTRAGYRVPRRSSPGERPASLRGFLLAGRSLEALVDHPGQIVTCGVFFRMYSSIEGQRRVSMESKIGRHFEGQSRRRRLRTVPHSQRQRLLPTGLA